jgi:DNA-binding transcriptional regulator/RsmH inhibitor MraZ
LFFEDDVYLRVFRGHKEYNRLTKMERSEKGAEIMESQKPESLIDRMARVLLGNVNAEDLDENNRIMISYYLELMKDIPKLRERVDARMDEMTTAAKKAEKPPQP